MTLESLKKTPLYESHLRYGGKIIDFEGWALPVQYEGIIQEHEAVRKAAGLFDVSHMGEIEVRGRDALKFVQRLITSDAVRLKDNQIIYALMCYENGGIVDDLLVYKFSEDDYYLVVNASNIDKDFAWMLDNKGGFDVEIINLSNEIAELALQGPLSEEILQKLTDTDLSQIKFFNFRRDIKLNGVNCLISRTGYTGEDGFEISTAPENVEMLWNKLLEAGRGEGIKPCGLGARDILRFEAVLPLYGNEIAKDITPLEAGLDYFVKFDKGDFIGREELLKQMEQGVARKLVGFEMKDKGISRHGYGVLKDGNNIGFVTTGYMSPTLKKSIGLALVDSKYSGIGETIEIQIRNKCYKAEIVSKVFCKKNYKR